MRTIALLLVVGAACTDQDPADRVKELRGRAMDCGLLTRDCTTITPVDSAVACLNDALAQGKTAMADVMLHNSGGDFDETVWFVVDGHSEKYSSFTNTNEGTVTWHELGTCKSPFRTTGATCPLAPITCE